MVWIAWKNIYLNWRHSLATMLAIMGGFVSVSLFDGFLRELEWQSYDGYVNRGMLGHLIVERKNARKMLQEDPWGYSLSKEEQVLIDEFLEENRKDIVSRARFLDLSGMITNGKSSTVFQGAGFDLKQGLEFRGDRWAWNVSAGKPLHLVQEPSAVLAMGLARFLDCQFNGHNYLKPDGSFIAEERPFECPRPTVQLSVTTEAAQVNALDLKVAGLTDMQIREFNERFLSIPMEVAQRLLDTDKVTRAAFLLKDESKATNLGAALVQKAKAKGFELDTYGWLDHPAANISKGGLEVLAIFRALFLTVVAVVAVMSVANTMMKSINERIREIGALRSFGFKRKQITLMFSAEGFFLGVLSCSLGLMASVILAIAISHSGLTYRAGVLSTAMPVHIQNAPLAWALSAVVLSVLCMVTAWLTARKASRMVIADALRHVA